MQSFAFLHNISYNFRLWLQISLKAFEKSKNQNSKWSNSTPPALDETNLVNFGPLTKKLCNCVCATWCYCEENVGPLSYPNQSAAIVRRCRKQRGKSQGQWHTMEMAAVTGWALIALFALFNRNAVPKKRRVLNNKSVDSCRHDEKYYRRFIKTKMQKIVETSKEWLCTSEQQQKVPASGQ